MECSNKKPLFAKSSNSFSIFALWKRRLLPIDKVTARYEQILSPSIGIKWFKTSRHINTANDFIQYRQVQLQKLRFCFVSNE